MRSREAVNTVAPGNSDDTVLVRPPVATATPQRRGSRLLWLVLGLVVGIAGTGAGFWAWQDHAPPPPRAEVPPPEAAIAVEAPLMGREAILIWQPTETSVVRLADRPAVFVIVFPSLAVQARMMNRVAALTEKAAAPRDRVLDDEALTSLITATGGTADTFYYGHDYALADLRRFFTLAHGEGIRLNAEERWLEALLPRLGAATPASEAAVITIPAESQHFDAAARRAVLDHEAGHGWFFTDPVFAEHVIRTWRESFTEADRAAFHRFLGREGYDRGIERLMANEAMAYLLFTPDKRFFDPQRDLGVDPATAERMRAAMRPR